MDKMKINVTITEMTGTTTVKVLMDGEASRNGLVHAVSEYLLALKQNINLALVTDGIEEFCERLGKDDEE